MFHAGNTFLDKQVTQPHHTLACRKTLITLLQEVALETCTFSGGILAPDHHDLLFKGGSQNGKVVTLCSLPHARTRIEAHGRARAKAIKKCPDNAGAPGWLSQLGVEHLVLAHITILRFVGSSPRV